MNQSILTRLRTKWKSMTKKVHPNANSPSPPPSDDDPMVTLTVWKKSLVLNCKGFTVFDCHGNLVYRVDYYSGSGSDNEIHLMDASGESLLTIRRKKLMGRLVTGNNSWSVFDRETSDSPRFVVVRKRSVIGNVHSSNRRYEIEGCYGKRRCAVYDEKRGRVAEIMPKETSVKGAAFGNDVFRLVVRPDFDAALAMAIVILLDRV